MRATMMAILLLLPAIAAGQDIVNSPSKPDPTAHRHLGFYFHFDIGAGYLLTKTDSGSLSGLSIPFALSLGGAVIENLIVAPELWTTLSPSPHESVQDVRAEAFCIGWGLNVTYYFMPSNVYMTMTPSYTHVNSYRGCPGGADFCVNANPPSYSLEANTFGMRTSVGKEWWISTHWGIGAAVEFIFTLTGHDSTTNGNAFAGALTLSTTYN